jgi:hypothetical protein
VGEVSPLNELYERFRDKGFEFFTVYVREPHPGENHHEHRSYEQKVQYACDWREQGGIKTTLVIDDLEGDVDQPRGHRACARKSGRVRSSLQRGAGA